MNNEELKQFANELIKNYKPVNAVAIEDIPSGDVVTITHRGKRAKRSDFCDVNHMGFAAFNYKKGERIKFLLTSVLIW